MDSHRFVSLRVDAALPLHGREEVPAADIGNWRHDCLPCNPQMGGAPVNVS